ncbi:hypothetical protein VTO42DRAFT_5027 [Malbranchea cinnamomea]
MPSYFYHISLELLPFTPPHLRQLNGSESESFADPSLVLRSAREALRPFRKRRPKAGKENSNNHPHVIKTSSPTDSSNYIHQNHAVPRGDSLNRQCVAAERDLPVRPAHSPEHANFYRTSTTPAQTPTDSHVASHLPYATTTADELAADRRLDRISFECIDMVPDPATASHQQQQQQQQQPKKSSGGENCNNNSNGNQIAKGIGTNVLGGLATKGKYIPLDQKVSDSIWGVVHLYRDAEETPGLGDADDDPSFLKGSAVARTSKIPAPATRNQFGSREVSRSSAYSTSSTLSSASSGAPNPDDCTTLCILAVPSYFSPSDFLGLVGEETRDEVSHFRMIRTARANRYMVLMKFRSARKAKEWQKDWNGKVFNSMEPETMHVVFVKNVEIQVAPPGSEGKFPDTINDPFTSGQAQSAALSTKPLAPPTPSLIELPTCPVCLERMDETTGLLTIICQHVFHCTCLQKWKGSGCPVCRYTQDDLGKRGNPFDFDAGPTECSVCHSEENLWLCLICGNIGCGRYDGAHAFAHFKQTLHSFAMDLASQRVWDYVGDGYVHRIIQNKADGKLVELPAADHSALDPPDWADAVPREKWENMSVEYTHLLTSQLESQRTYFEEKVERAVDKASQATAAAASAQEAAEKATSLLQDLQAKYDTLVNETIPSLERDKGRAERRADKFETMARQMEKEWREEKTINASLMERVKFLDEEVQRLKAANEDLSEQNRDLSFFISGMEKLKDQGEDVVEGTISVPDPPKKNNRKGKGRRR